MVYNVSKRRKSFLCSLGFHKWGRPRFIYHISSNVRDYSKTCLRCGEVRKWVESKR